MWRNAWSPVLVELGLLLVALHHDRRHRDNDDVDDEHRDQRRLGCEVGELHEEPVPDGQVGRQRIPLLLNLLQRWLVTRRALDVDPFVRNPGAMVPDPPVLLMQLAEVDVCLRSVGKGWAGGLPG